MAFAILTEVIVGAMTKPGQPTIEKLFQGGVVVSFRPDVAQSRIDQIVASTRGTIGLYDAALHIVLIRFHPPLKTIEDADAIAKDLESLDDVRWAGPEMSAFAN